MRYKQSHLQALGKFSLRSAAICDAMRLSSSFLLRLARAHYLAASVLVEDHGGGLSVLNGEEHRHGLEKGVDN